MTDDEALEEGQRRIWHLLDLIGDGPLLRHEIESMSEAEARVLLGTAVLMLYVLRAPRRPVL